MIKSVYYDQTEILQSIMQLCAIDAFCADISYGNGKFYEKLQKPLLKFDISPQVDGVIAASSSALPLESNSLKSIVFDPPFLTYVRDARDGNGKMVMAK